MFVAIFIKISPYFFQYQTYGIAVNRWRIMSDGNLQNCFLFQGRERDTGHEVTVKRVVRVYPTPSPSTRRLCEAERRKLPRWGLGWNPIRKRLLDVLCDFTPVCSMQVLSLEGSKSSLQRQWYWVTQKQSIFVDCWCWHNGKRTETPICFVDASPQTSLLDCKAL